MDNLKKRLLLGSHVSTAKSLSHAFERGSLIGANCIQIFTKNCRQWRCKPLTPEEVEDFKAKQKEFNMELVISHASYLINIGSAEENTYQRSKQILKEEIQRCILLNIPYLVLHPGTVGNGDLDQCLQRISSALVAILEEYPGSTMILLENTAGQGTSVGFNFEQLALIHAQTNYHNRIGFCFDTCHAFAAAYKFSTPAEYEDMWRLWDNILGLKNLKVMHINDSKKPAGSRIDRHAHIGEGLMGNDPFSLIFNDKRFFDIPKILETPKDSIEDDIRNMETIKKLILPTTAEILGMKLD